MKPTRRNSLAGNLLLASSIFLSLGAAADAGSVYWDTNGLANGSGAATGTWGASAFWTTTEVGNVATSGTLPTANDDVFVAAGTSGTTGTITIDTTKVAGSLTLQEPATGTGVTISGGTSLTLGGGTTATKGLFVSGNGAHTVSTPLILSGANTIQNAGTGTLTVNGGITGTGDLALRNNNTGATGINISSQPVNNIGAISNTGTNTGTVVLGNANGSPGTGSAGLGANVTSFSQDSANSPFQFLNANNSAYTGAYNINAGTLQFSGTNTTGTITSINAASVINLGATSGNAAATLAIGNNAVSGKLNNNINVRAGSTGVKTMITVSTSTNFATSGLVTLDDNLTLTPPGLTTFGFTFNNSIVDGSSGPKGITKSGAGSVYLAASNTFSGATSLTNGTLQLTGANGSLPNTSGITVLGGTFQLNNTAAANNTNRVLDSAVISMTSGTLDFKNDAAAATNFSETVALTAAAGGVINASQAAADGSSTLTIGTFVRNTGAALSFTGTGLGINSRNRIVFNTPPSLTNGVIPWAIYGTSTFATHDNTNGITPAATTDIDAQGSTIADDFTSNLRILPDGTGAAIALGAPTTSINTLIQANVGATVNPTIDTLGKTFRAYSILVASGARPLAIGSTAGDGTLTAGTSGGELLLINNSASALTLNAVIADNGTSSSVSKAGTGDATFAGSNTYTGATTLNGGVVTAANNNAFGSGTVTINNPTKRLVVANGITISNSITFNGGGEAFRGVFENSATGGNATLAGPITISGNLAGGGHFGSASGGTLTISGPITSTSTSPVVRAGVVILSGVGTASNYTSFNASAGVTRLGATDALLPTATLDMGASADSRFDLNGFNQTLAGIIRSGNSTFIGNASLTDNSILTITGTSTYSGSILNVLSPGTQLTTLRIANGANLTLTGAFSATTPDIQSGGTLTIGAGAGDTISPSTKALLVPSGATLKFTGTNRVQNDTVITVNSGGTFDENGQFDTIGYLNGAGSIINLNATLSLNMPLDGSGSNFSGTISGTSGITVAGLGTGGSDTNLQILSGVNSFTGNVSVQRGLLRITNSSALGAAPVAGTKTISISATSNKFLELDGTSGDISLPSTFLFSTSGLNGTIRNLAGNNTIDGAFSLTSGNGNTKIVSDGGSLTLNGDVTTVSSAAANRVFDLDGTSTANNAVNGVISNGGGFLTGVTKNGVGKWTLAGANTYTSPTTVNGGTLHLTGSLAAGSAVTVGGAAATGTPTLTGAGGTVNGTLNVAAAGGGAAGTVSPGTVGTTGTLNAGATTIAGTYACDVTASAADVLNVTGNLDITGATLAVSAVSPAASSYTIATYSGILTGTFTASPALPAGYTLDYTTPNVIKLVTASTPYDTWINGYPSITGLDKLSTADPDNDGLTNFDEFAFGLIPDSGSSVNPITLQLSKTNGQFTYQRLAASGLTYTIWTSDNLAVWTEDTGAVQTASPAGANQSVLVTLSATAPLAAPKTFVRVKAD